MCDIESLSDEDQLSLRKVNRKRLGSSLPLVNAPLRCGPFLRLWRGFRRAWLRRRIQHTLDHLIGAPRGLFLAVLIFGTFRFRSPSLVAYILWLRRHEYRPPPGAPVR